MDTHESRQGVGGIVTFVVIPQLGVPVHCQDLERVLDTVDDFVEEGRVAGRSHQVVTVNTDFLVQAKKHPDVHAILRNADLAVPDGMPIVWAAAALGHQGQPRIAGADLVPLLAARSVERGYRLTFFGGGGDVAIRSAKILTDANPGLVVQSLAPDVGANGETDQEVLDAIRSFGPDIICVALGHPKQERWIRRYAARLGIPVAIGVGGTFDFIAGETRRAPDWLQQSGFEWLYRLAQSPGRLASRYLTDIAVFIPSILLQIARTRWVRPTDTDLPFKEQGEVVVVRETSDEVVLALSQPGEINHQTAAALARHATEARRSNRRIRLVAPDFQALRSLNRLGLDRLIPFVPEQHLSETEMARAKLALASDYS